MPGSFFDTNVLLYIASGDRAKADRAEVLIGEGGAISVQVLNEIANVARRKMALSWPETHEFLDMIRRLLPVHPITVEIHETGLALAERYGLSLYDALIAASALQADCDTLWSEDLQDGIMIEGRLRVVNPFRAGRFEESATLDDALNAGQSALMTEWNNEDENVYNDLA